MRIEKVIGTVQKVTGDGNDEVWLMFVRNRGDEGYCSSQLWDAGFEDYTFHIHWPSNMKDVDVNWNETKFEGTDGTSGPVVKKLKPDDPTKPPSPESGVYVTFHLGPSTSGPFIDGALHLKWTGPPAIPSPLPRREIGNVSEEEEADEVEEYFKAQMAKLTPTQRREFENARRVTPRHVVYPHPLTGPIQRVSRPPALPRIGRLHAIKAGPATKKAKTHRAQLRALCTVTDNAPPGFPTSICNP